MFALTIPTTCVAAVARPGPEHPRGARGASLAGRHVGSTGGDRVAMRVGGARAPRALGPVSYTHLTLPTIYSV